MGYHSFMGYGLKVPAYQVAGPVELRGYGLPPMVKRGPIYDRGESGKSDVSDIPRYSLLAVTTIPYQSRPPSIDCCVMRRRDSEMPGIKEAAGHQNLLRESGD